jgi:hypothetical protein
MSGRVGGDGLPCVSLRLLIVLRVLLVGRPLPDMTHVEPLRRSRHESAPTERLLTAVIPRPLPRPAPTEHPVPALPQPHLPTGSARLLIGMARVDRSGRVCQRRLLWALGWSSGQPVQVSVVHRSILVAADPTGLSTVGSRGEVALPAAARAWCGIAVDESVVLAAAVADDVLVVHPAATVAALLAEYHAQLREAGHDR